MTVWLTRLKLTATLSRGIVLTTEFTEVTEKDRLGALGDLGGKKTHVGC
jgi:hypothetical protein